MDVRKWMGRMTPAMSSGATKKRGAGKTMPGPDGSQSGGAPAHSDTRQRERSADTLDREAKRPAQPNNPDLAARIKAMQSQRNQASGKGVGARLRNGIKARPGHIRANVLYELGVTKTSQRSKEIISGLITIGILDSDYNLSRPLTYTESITDALKLTMKSHRVQLTAKEEHGLGALLTGIDESLHELGHDIAALPRSQRLQWLFYAGLENSPGTSNNRILSLQNNGILDKDYLPLNGGAAFEQYISDTVQMLKFANSARTAAHTIKHLEAIRQALFPLPTYT